MSRWLEAERVGIEQLGEVCVEAFLAAQRATGRDRSSLSRPGLLCLLELLREVGVVAAPVRPASSPTDALMSSFRCYLLAERGLSAGTVRGYVDRATRFVVGLAPGGLAHATPAEVTAAVLRESAAVSVSATQNFVASLRAFLRFCFVEGLIEIDLSQAALPVTGSPPTRPTRCSPPATGARRSAGATSRCSSSCCVWACAGARWRA